MGVPPQPLATGVTVMVATTFVAPVNVTPFPTQTSTTAFTAEPTKTETLEPTKTPAPTEEKRANIDMSSFKVEVDQVYKGVRITGQLYTDSRYLV